MMEFIGSAVVKIMFYQEIKKGSSMVLDMVQKYYVYAWCYVNVTILPNVFGKQHISVIQFNLSHHILPVRYVKPLPAQLS